MSTFFGDTWYRYDTSDFYLFKILHCLQIKAKIITSQFNYLDMILSHNENLLCFNKVLEDNFSWYKLQSSTQYIMLSNSWPIVAAEYYFVILYHYK